MTLSAPHIRLLHISRILLRHPQHKPSDFFGHGGLSLQLVSPVVVVPLFSHQLAMPTQDGIRSEDRGDFPQNFASQDLAFDGQAAPLIVVQDETFPAQLLHQYLDLRALKLDDSLLMPIDPAGQNDHQQMPRL